jgi:predicted phage gp36 major capsid-like protein
MSANPVDNFTAVTQTATLELTTRQWRVIIIALNEAQTAPKASRALAEDIAELMEVQIK